MSYLIRPAPHAPTPALGDWSDVAALGQGPAGDAPMQLDGGNETFSNASGKTPVAAPTNGPRTAVIVVAGQSYAANMPFTDPDAYVSQYTPRGAVSQLNVFDGNFYAAADPLLGTSGVGGSMWTRMADRLIQSGKYDSVVLVPLAVGGSSVHDWQPGGSLFRKLELAFRELQTAGGLAPTHFIWEQGVADSVSDPNAYASALFSMFGTLRSHGMTAPIYMNVNSESGGTVAPDPGVAAKQAAFGAEQSLIATSYPGLGIFQGVNFNQQPGLYTPDGHFTSAGLDYFASEWTSLIDGIATVAPTADGVVARLSDGQIAVATANSSGVLTPAMLPVNFGSDWNLIGVADGDNLLFQSRSTAQVQLQAISGNAAAGGGALTNQLNWPVVAIGDFNNDQKADIVYQQPGGGVPIIQFLDGATAKGGGGPNIYTFGSEWAVVGAAQANSATESDLILHDTQTQQYALQFQHGITETGGGLITAQPWDSTWQLLGVGDFRGTGRLDDLVFEQPSSGIVEVQFINSTTSVGGGVLGNNPFDSTWDPVGVKGNELFFQRKTDGLLEHATINGSLTVVGGGVLSPGSASSFGLDSMFGSHPLGAPV